MNSSINIHSEGFEFQGVQHKYVWEFPNIIKNKAKPNKYGVYAKLSWTIYVGILERYVEPKKIQTLLNSTELNDIDTLFSQICIPIEKVHFNHSPIGKTAFTIVDSYQVGSKHKFGVPSLFNQGKNLGKKNMTNEFTQAMSKAYSLWNLRTVNSELYAPMLADGSAILKDREEQEIIDCFNKYKDFYAQIKFDGIRCMAKFDGELTVYSRNLKNIQLGEYMLDEMKQLAGSINSNGYTIILDGELYIHGLPLSEISGIVREYKGMYEQNKQRLKYYIFDIVFLKNNIPNKLNFNQRYEILKINFKTFKYLELVKNYQPKNPKELSKLYNAVIDKGFEGLVLRNNTNYSNENRSRMYKMKRLFRDEFSLVGFKDGTGKSKGLVIFECELTQQSINNGLEFKLKRFPEFNITVDNVGDTFNVTPKDTEDNRRQLFRQLSILESNGFTNFENNYKGKPYTVEFQDYSDDLIPLRPIGIEIRTDI